MSGAKLEELVRRAQALQDRLNQTQIKPNEKISTVKNSTDENVPPKSRTTPNKLSLKKKKKAHKYFENKENVSVKSVTAKAKKDKLFGSIQFSSDEDNDQSVACGKCDGAKVSVQKPPGISMSVDYPHTTDLPTLGSSLDLFVPDSCDVLDSQSNSNVFSQNLSDLVRPDNVVNIKDSFSSEVSDIIAGHVGDRADVNCIPETQPNGNDLASPAPDHMFEPECISNKVPPQLAGVDCDILSNLHTKSLIGRMEINYEDSISGESIASSSRLSEPSIEESVLMLSQRFENMLTHKNKKRGPSKKPHLISEEKIHSSRPLPAVFSGRLPHSPAPKSSTKKGKKRVGVKNTSINHAKLCNAIYFSSSEDDAASGAHVELDVSSHSSTSPSKSIGDTDHSVSSLSDVGLPTKPDQSRDEVTFLMHRMETIMSSSKNKKSKATVKPATPAKSKKKPKKSKKLVLPDLFESESDDGKGDSLGSSEMNTTSPPASAHSAEAPDDHPDEYQVESQNISLQVSMSSPGSPVPCVQDGGRGSVTNLIRSPPLRSPVSTSSTPNNGNIHPVKKLSNTLCSPLALHLHTKRLHPSGQNPDSSPMCYVHDMTSKSLQCSFSSQDDQDTSQVLETSCVPADLTSKSLQVSMLSEDGLSPGGVTPAVSPSPDKSASDELDCSDSDQPAQCNMSLQVSIMSSEPSLNNADSEMSLSDADRSSVVDDALYKTAMEPELELSDHVLYKTVAEFRDLSSPVEALFPGNNEPTSEDDARDQMPGRYGQSSPGLSINQPQRVTQPEPVLLGNNENTIHLDSDEAPSVCDEVPAKMKHRTTFLISSSESEDGSHQGLLNESGSESDVTDRRFVPRSPAGSMRSRTSCDDRHTSLHAATAAAIGPDEMYEEQEDANTIRSPPKQARELTETSDEDDLESFFQKLQKPKAKLSKPTSMGDFIVADDELSSAEEDESIFYLRTDRAMLSGSNRASRSSFKTPRSTALQHSPSPPLGSPDMTEDESDDQDNLFKTPARPPVKPTSLTCKPQLSRPVLSNINNLATPKRKPPSVFDKRPLIFDRPNSTGHAAVRKGFLASLAADANDHERHMDSIKYVRNFKKHKEELTAKLFQMYNDTVFVKKLPSDLSVVWNTRMYKTAGYCTYKKTPKVEEKTARVELSVKVCDSAERVRDTLIHELCHAAVWLFNGKTDGHGPYWKHWAHKANLIHPDLPVISRCHNYKIQTKYTYKCTRCGYQIGRHSKSLDTATKVCGYCQNPFELITNSKNGSKNGAQTPRTPNRFAMFVKENYGTIKKHGKLSHKEVMNKLSAEFALKNQVTT